MPDRHEECEYRKPTGGSVRWGSRRWRIKSSGTQSYRFSTRSGKRTLRLFVRIPAGAQPAGVPAGFGGHWMRCTSG